MEYEQLIVQKDYTIINTMKMMDELHHKSLLVYDGDKFYSIVTIGDLQRAIISNYDLNSPISAIIKTEEKQYAYITDNIEDIKKQMLRIRCEFMPVLDCQGNLSKVYFWDDLFASGASKDTRASISIPVVIMAGGLGTRLKPLTNVIPKPLIPIGEKTILEEIMNQFEGIGCKKFYMSINYKAEMIRFYMNQLDHKYDIDFFEEPKPLGTIGSVSLLKGKIDTPFFVSNCDILIDQDYRDVYEYHINNHNDLTIVTAIKSFKIPYGVIETGDNGLMKGIKEKPEQTYMINTGVYVLNPELIDEIPEGEFYHITQMIDNIRKHGGRIGCFPVSDHAWRDMGDWNEYFKMIK